MTEAQAVEAMLEKWQVGWTALHGGGSLPARLPFTFGGDNTDPPYTFENEAMVAPDTWIRVSIVNTVRTQTTSGPKGSRRFEQRGRIAVQIFAGVDQGVAQLAALSDDVRAVFEGEAVTVGSEEVALFEGNSTPVPTDGRWAMRLVTVPFLYTCIA